MSNDVYVLGVDMIKFGKFPDRSVESLGAEAALMALDDAGLGMTDVEALYELLRSFGALIIVETCKKASVSSPPSHWSSPSAPQQSWRKK